MACPFFFPTTRLDAELWPHRRRLPLGDGFAGKCTAPGAAECAPDEQELGKCCNLGYATECGRLPRDRHADAVHFCVARDCDGVVALSWVLVKDHVAAGHGTLEYQRIPGFWAVSHADPNLQRMAECYLQSYLSRRNS